MYVHNCNVTGVWAVSLMEWGLGRKKKEARGGPRENRVERLFPLPIVSRALLLLLLGHPASGSLCGEESCDFVIRE